MKVYKQIDLSPEKRAIWSFVAGMSFICSLILISPVFAEVHNPGFGSAKEIYFTPFKTTVQCDHNLLDTIRSVQKKKLYNLIQRTNTRLDPIEDSLSKISDLKWFMAGYLNGLFCSDRIIYKPGGDTCWPEDSIFQYLRGLDFENNDATDDFFLRYQCYKAEHKKLLEKYFTGN